MEPNVVDNASLQLFVDTMHEIIECRKKGLNTDKIDLALQHVEIGNLDGFIGASYRLSTDNKQYYIDPTDNIFKCLVV